MSEISALIKIDPGTRRVFTCYPIVDSDQEEMIIKKALAPILKPSLKCRLARWALPWVASVFTRLPFNTRLSLLLDRLQALAYD